MRSSLRRQFSAIARAPPRARERGMARASSGIVPPVSIDLGRRLIAAGLVPPEEVEAALFLSVARGVPFTRALIDRGAITERGLEDELERVGGLGLRQVAGAAELVARLPRALCRRLAALPTRLDPVSGAVDVAAADALDPHVAAEFGFHLGAPIRVLRAPIAAIEEAIRRLELDEPTAPHPPRQRRATPPFPHGAPQSSNPPPALDETPIPLVRRISSNGAAPEAVPPAPPRLAVTAPYGMGVTARPSGPSRSTMRPAMLPDPPADPVVAMPPAPARETPTFEPRAVSFPSLPPEDSDQRLTPPYGSPVLAPPAARVELGRRAAPRGDAPRGGMVSHAEEATPPEPAPPQEEAPPPRKVRAPDGAAVLDALAQAASRDEVIRHAMRGMRLVARRLAVFVVKRDGFHGWACNVELGDAELLREVVIAVDLPSVLATATATAMYLGPIPATAAHEALLQVMETSSPDVAAVAARISGRPALVLLADDLDDTLTGTRFLGELAWAVGEALTRLLAR